MSTCLLHYPPPHPSISSEAPGSICFVFKDSCSRCRTRPSFKGSHNGGKKNIASIVYHRTYWPSAGWVSADGLGLTVFDKVHCTWCTVPVYLVHCTLQLVHCALYLVHCALHLVQPGLESFYIFKNWWHPQSHTPKTQKHKKNCCDKLDYYGEWVGRGVSCWIGAFCETTPG